MNHLHGAVEKLIQVFSRTDIPAVTAVELWGVIAAAALLSIPRGSWKYIGLLATTTHELGHAFAALTSGQRLAGIRLRMDHSGTTTTFSRSKLASAWSCFWGYPVPALTGAALVWAGFTGWGPAAMAAGTAVLVAALVFLRNTAGFLIMAAVIACNTGLILLVPAGFVGHVCIVLGLVLLVGAARDLLKLTNVHLRRRAQLSSSDAYLLYRATAVPSVAWITLFAVFVAGSWFTAWQPVSAILLPGT